MVAAALTGLYLAAAGIAVAYLLWSAVAETGHRHVRWIKSKLRPSAPAPRFLPPRPFVTIAPQNTDLGFTPPMEVVSGADRKLSRIGMNFDVENKDTHPVRDVRAGVRTRDGQEAIASSFHAGVIGAQETARVRHFEIPSELVAEVPHESEWPNFFLLWAQFTDHAGHTWKVMHDRSLDTERETYELVERHVPSGH